MLKPLGDSGHHTMIRKRASTGRIVAQVIVFLLLCGIVGGEIPELLTLTDNCSNDFAVRKTNSAISSLLHGASKHVRAANGAPEIGISFSHFGPIERAALVPSAALIPDTVVRT
jgi:hypothetical protein